MLNVTDLYIYLFDYNTQLKIIFNQNCFEIVCATKFQHDKSWNFTFDFAFYKDIRDEKSYNSKALFIFIFFEILDFISL